MKRVILVIIVTLSMAACGSQPAAPPGTGIQGVVQVGPTCPVERINSPCPPHPLAATVVVRDGAAAEVTRFTSGADGRFKVNLRPGTYGLTGLPIGSSPMPRPMATSVTVTQGSYAAVNVEYDSGIR